MSRGEMSTAPVVLLHTHLPYICKRSVEQLKVILHTHEKEVAFGLKRTVPEIITK